MKNTVINFKITTLSPVCILDEDGKRLSPYIDIIKDKDSIIELDKEKIINSIINDNRSFNRYLNILKNKSQNSIDKFTMQKLIEDKGLKIENITYRKIQCKSSINNLIEVHSCMKSNGKAYIPGSSLKGAIRTAILFNSSNEKQILERIDYLEDLKPKIKCSTIKKSYVGEDVFRSKPNDIQSDKFKYLIVRDSERVKSNLVIYEARSINIFKNKNKSEIPLDMRMLLECIDIGEELNFQIVIKDEYFEKEKIFNYINEFYEKVIAREIEEVLRIYDVESKNKLINEYSLLLEKIRLLKRENSGFILRVGRLKGYFSNSITSQCKSETLSRITNIYKVKKRKKINEFPTTKWVVTNNENIDGLFGWVQVKEV